MVYTYKQACTAFKNEVNQKHPPGSNITGSKRYIKELGQGGQGQGSGRGGPSGRGCGFGRGGQGGRVGQGGRGNRRGFGDSRVATGRGEFIYKSRSDSRIITLMDGKRFKYLPSFNFRTQYLAKCPMNRKG